MPLLLPCLLVSPFPNADNDSLSHFYRSLATAGGSGVQSHSSDIECG